MGIPTLKDYPALDGTLFVGHDASRTGAPMVLLHYLRWFRQAFDSKFSCLLVKGGEMEKDFSAVCPVLNLESISWRQGSARRRMLERMKLPAVGKWSYERALRKKLDYQPALIYCNTVVSLNVLLRFPWLQGKVICHVHELEFALTWLMSAAVLKETLSKANRFIACSQAVADNLIEKHAIPAKRIDVVHEFIPEDQPNQDRVANNRTWLREKLKVGADTFIVGGSGQLGWRKGTDLFVQLAKLVKGLEPKLDIHFVWVGGTANSSAGLEFAHDINLGGMSDHITLVPSQQNPTEYFCGLDLFVLTSREDPYPLVCLEVAQCSVPTVCFDRAGGIPEFIESDSGVIVPYLDVHAMAVTVIDLLHSRERREHYGSNCRDKVRLRHSTEMAGPAIVSAMQATLNG